MFFEALDLNVIWYALVGLLLTGYAVLDGFDLGVGALHLLVKKDEERRIFLNAIGPVWDGNEVWLVTGGGALFAAFPEVYASAFSGFYIPFMLLLVMLIFRAVAIEFRSKEPWPWWRQMWDVSFAISSIASSLLLGVALGNVALGVPLGADHEFRGDFLSLLNPYALLVGLTTLAMFMMHASIYLVMKTEGELHDRIRDWIKNTIAFFVICYVTTTMATLLYVPRMTEHVREQPMFFVLALLNMLAIANIPREYYHGRDGRAFICSCLNVILLMALFGLGVFPFLLPSSINPEYGLHIYNAASSQKTLQIMLTIAALAVPLVIAYTVSVYWIFRGKVKLNSKSY
ncbi:MAG TPA: cytochrome d ubiquinol oxidase subunit II [Oculatellaceae cyanobacterium]|jgi:cytochrome d ubiquinol oxidase subunit II